MKTLFYNIKELVQVRENNTSILKGNEMKELPSIKNAFLLIENDVIVDYGSMEHVPKIDDESVDVSGKIIVPSYIDSHTHIVYAGNREQEFVDRINGLSYDEIYQRGGGILNSVEKLRKASEDELYCDAANRLEELISLGTGAVEIKSGYGLDLESELKMLRVIRRLKDTYPVAIKATFLGAHAVPAEFKNNQSGFVEEICEKMIPEIAKSGLADYVDAFLETGYFTVHETQKIIQTAAKYGLKSKIHVNQFTSIDGIKMCVEENVLSVDHLEIVTDKDIEALKKGNTIPVALPTCSYFISIPYTPARTLLNAGLPLAIASDYNPGTTPSGNMNFVVATACIKMKLTPEEAINAATLNAAYAMELEKEYGSITKGKKASFFITKPIHSIYAIPYNFGSNLISEVYLNGKKQ
ncbi:MAG TPA: imidazolonepropionase [Flavobacterium sp.]|nr:imidazolonepropionase [Flavobacterium sp.]